MKSTYFKQTILMQKETKDCYYKYFYCVEQIQEINSSIARGNFRVCFARSFGLKGTL